MYFDRFEKKADGTILRFRNVQTELAEWEEISPRGWVRRMKQWK